MSKLTLAQVPICTLAEEVQNEIEEATFAGGQRMFDNVAALVGSDSEDNLIVCMPDRECMWRIMLFKIIKLKLHYNTF